VELVGWKRASHRSEKASRNIFQLLQSARWAVLLQQCGRSRLQNLMVSFLMGLQGGFTKFHCFLCLKNSITKTWWGTTFGGFFEKAICNTLANLENIITSEPLWVIIDCVCLFTMQVLFFLSDRMNDNIKISLVCHNKYDFFVLWS